MRKLKTRDVFAFARCLKKIGAKDRIQTAAQEANTVKDVWAFGFDMMWDIFDVATEADAEMELYKFFAGPFETTPEGVADMDLDELQAGLKQLAEENNLLSFFKSAAKSMK
jgi:hypothetical protein